MAFLASIDLAHYAQKLRRSRWNASPFEDSNNEDLGGGIPPRDGNDGRAR